MLLGTRSLPAADEMLLARVLNRAATYIRGLCLADLRHGNGV